MHVQSTGIACPSERDIGRTNSPDSRLMPATHRLCSLREFARQMIRVMITPVLEMSNGDIAPFFLEIPRSQTAVAVFRRRFAAQQTGVCEKLRVENLLNMTVRQ